VHHVILRGIERRRIFVDDTDREDLVSRLSRLAPALGFTCFAWVLMPNHVHLVVRSGPVRISRLMARTGTGYARRFNARHDRVGHLFQNRFFSRQVGDETDLLGLILYVTRNPLEAGIVQDVTALARFPWCGLGALLGTREPHPFESCDEALSLFGRNPREARSALLARLGDPGAAAAEEQRAAPCTSVSPARPATSFEQVLREACGCFRVAETKLVSRSRDFQVVEARRAIARRASQELGLSGAEIARRLRIARAAVSHMLRRGGPSDPAI
jgi:REP element-mobilizing transposase RayT